MAAAGLLQPRYPGLVVAVSGGVDSTALLIALTRLQTALRSGQCITACHIDHGLRPEAERATEQKLLKQQCLRLGVSLQIIAVDVIDEQRRRRLSWEDAARRCRYAALGNLAERIEAGAVITGHTRDDQVETVLMRILRGTGLRGLRGMDALSRPWGAAGPLLVRPLLPVSRAETEAYCREAGAVWSTDSTNASGRFVRNRVRQQLLPALAAEYPSAMPALLRLAGQAGDFTAWLDGEVAAAMDRIWSEWDGGATLTTPPVGMPGFIRGHVVAEALTRLLHVPGPPSGRLVDAVTGLWVGRSGRRLAVGGGWHAEATGQGLLFRSVGSQLRLELRDDWRELEVGLVPGETAFDGWQVTVCPTDGQSRQQDDPAEEGLIAYLPVALADAGFRLSVRYWKPGARLQPTGMEHEKKLQDIFINEKVPRKVRHETPLLYLDGRCVWVVGVKRSGVAGPVPTAVSTVRVAFELARPADDVAGVTVQTWGETSTW